MENFIFYSPTEILFGKNQIQHLASKIENKRVLLAYGSESIKNLGLYKQIIDIFKNNKIFYKELNGIKPNPKISSVREGIELCRKYDLDFILAAGGGSVIDCSKAIALGYFYKGDAWEMFNLSFAEKEEKLNKALPLACILTLSATGTEMNANAVVSNEETKEKIPIYAPCVKPRFSILDPTYTFSVPQNQTKAGVVDILSHIFEQYFSPTKGAYVQDNLAFALIKTCMKYGQIACDNPRNYEARANLMWSSTLALNGLLSCGKITDWTTHQIEHAVSAITDITHGVGLAILTPYWMEYVFSENTIEKFVEYGKNIWNLQGLDTDIAKKSIEKTKEYFNLLGMPKSLSEIGVKKENLEEIAQKTMLGRKYIGKFKKLDEMDVMKILENAY